MQIQEIHKISIAVGDKVLNVETGKVAKQANGSCMVTCGGTTVLATVCAGARSKEILDFVPVSVEYNEKFYAAGKIPGSFNRREGRPSMKEILTSRIIDRPMRPLFDPLFGCEIQIVPTVVSADQINPPDMVAVVAASFAVTLSDIPFNGPIAGVRVAYLGGRYVVNPTFDEIEKSQMDIVVAGTEGGITMVEGGAKEVSEEIMLGAIAVAEPEIRKVCQAISSLREKAGKPKQPLMKKDPDPEYFAEVSQYALPLIKEAAFADGGKLVRAQRIADAKKNICQKFSSIIENDDKAESVIDALVDDIHTKLLRSSILDEDRRVDGRNTHEIRPITCEAHVLPIPHGSALFTRGETQSLATTTLGTDNNEQLIDSIDGDTTYLSFMLHYNFPPFSVGETGKLSTGRREIGHGHLAQRALEAVLPPKNDFPYVIRVVSDITESNGSSSMATVCGGCLSLMDAGVPIKRPVAGIAMGLITDDDKYTRYKILTDILGEEDHMGDMDFKVAGTREGITAFQMDIKIAGVSAELMKEALERAKEARFKILDIMAGCLSEPRNHVSGNAPTIINLRIDEKKIGAVIGTGGSNIKKIQMETGADVSISDDGSTSVSASTRAKAERAVEMINLLIEEPEVGKIYQGTVKRIMDFGAFVEFLPKCEGLCHISKLSRRRVSKVEDVLKVGQIIPVKLIEIDRMGRVNLSYIDALEANASQG